MSFDDIAEGDAVRIRIAGGEIAVQALKGIKEKNGMRIVAWTNSYYDGTLITNKNFLGFQEN